MEFLKFIIDSNDIYLIKMREINREREGGFGLSSWKTMRNWHYLNCVTFRILKYSDMVIHNGNKMIGKICICAMCHVFNVYTKERELWRNWMETRKWVFGLRHCVDESNVSDTIFKGHPPSLPLHSRFPSLLEALSLNLNIL